jgi:hypothetical protein
MNQSRGKHSLLKKKWTFWPKWIPVRKHVTLAARLGIAPSTLNAVVKNMKDTEKYHAKCGRFSGQRKSLKQPLFQELKSLLTTLFGKGVPNSVVVGGTLLREKYLHIAIEDFKTSISGSPVSSSDMVLCTKLY